MRLGAYPAALAVLLALLTAALSAQTVTNPDLYEKSLEASRQAMAFYGVYDDPAELRRINDIGYRLAQESVFRKFPFTFYLVDMPEPNAFALPGGQIFLTRGMLDLALDDDMLAGLLGHEIAHVTLEHGLKMQRRATLLNVLSQALLVGVVITADSSTPRGPTAPYDPRSGGSNRGDRIMGAAAAGVVVSELLLRSYSREFEDQADDEGQRLAAAAGFDPGGTRELMNLMRARLPEHKEYGYWRTHPFFDQRVRAAEVRTDLLKVQEVSTADDYRQRTQATLLEFGERPKLKRETVELIKLSALNAWPRGRAAERLRLENLHRLRDAELKEKPLSRDYGTLLAAYRKEADEVAAIDPESTFPASLEQEMAGFRQSLGELYPQAAEVFRKGVYETHFLETFRSNFPNAAELPKVALELGDAYSRLGRPGEAVKQYLFAWTEAPESEPGRSARAGLRAMTPVLTRLEALQELALQEGDAELRDLAAERLKVRVHAFEELANGAEYLKRYPGSPYAEAVSARLDSLADNLYGEILLYQTVGDHGKALERIQAILTQAPLSPAAERLRKQAVLEG